MDKKKMKKAIEPTHVKIEKVGQEIAGEFVGIQQSGKHADGFALKYNVDDKPCVCFVNSQAKDLFDSTGIKQGEKFLLEFKEERENKEGTYKYRVFELYTEG